MDINVTGNNDRHDPRFFKVVLPLLKEYLFYKVTRRDINLISELVVKHFGLNNKFELKDKFEGEAFLKTKISSYSTLVALNKFLDLNIDVNESGLDLLNDGFIQIGKSKFRVVDFHFGELPGFVYDKKWIGNGIIFSLHRDEHSCFLCGFIHKEELLDLYKKSQDNLNVSRTQVKTFVDFKSLKSVLTLKG